MTSALLLAAFVAAQTATAGASIEWFYDDVDLPVGPVAVFVVCLDQQPTSACARVDAVNGAPDAVVAGRKWWRWKLPPLLEGPHVVVIQACTAGAAACSSGASVKFTFAAIRDVGGARLVGSGGA
jgi:hypothetical protein